MKRFVSKVIITSAACTIMVGLGIVGGINGAIDVLKTWNEW